MCRLEVMPQHTRVRTAHRCRPSAPMPELPADNPPRRGRSGLMRDLATLLPLILAAVLATRPQSEAAPTTFDRFWAPLLTATGPVLLCAGGLDMYELPLAVKQAANAAATSTANPPLLSLSPRQVQRVGARYVAIADAVAHRADRGAVPAARPSVPNPRAQPHVIRRPPRLSGRVDWDVLERLDPATRLRVPLRADHRGGRSSRRHHRPPASRSLVASPPAVAVTERVARLRAGFEGPRSGHGNPRGHGRRHYSVRDRGGRRVPDHPGRTSSARWAT